MLTLEGRYKARGLRVVSVTPINRLDNEDERAGIAEAIREERMPYACYLDAGAEWSLATGLRQVPSFALIDRAGRVRYRARGVVLQGNDEFRALEAAIVAALPATTAGRAP